MNHPIGHIHYNDHDHDDNNAMDGIRQLGTNPSSLASNCDTQCELDLRQDYTNAVDCLVSCEFIIKTLQQQLAAKDVELASKDETISSLETKIVDMSLELASTLSREEELQHRLQKSFTGTMSSTSTRTRAMSRTISSPQHLTNTTEIDSIIPPPPNDALIAFNKARYRPISTSSRKKTSQAVKAATACDNNNNGNNNTTPHNSTNLLRTSFTSTATTAKTNISNATSSNTILSRQGGGGWLQGGSMMTSSKNNNDDDDGTATITPSRFSNLGLGKIFQKGTRRTEEEEEDQTMPLPTSRSSKMFGSKASEMDVDFGQSSNNRRLSNSNNNNSRRPSSRKPIELRKSSRSFLEASGVVFPVSSFEVLNKGCLARVISKGSKGALAHRISKGSKGCMRATSSMDLLKKGCMVRSKMSKGGTNEEWPEFDR